MEDAEITLPVELVDAVTKTGLYNMAETICQLLAESFERKVLTATQWQDVLDQIEALQHINYVIDYMGGEPMSPIEFIKEAEKT